MTSLHLSDLPASVRAKVEAQEGHAATARTTRQADGERGPAYRCATPGCDAAWPGWSEAGTKRHNAEAGHGRFAAVIG